MHILSVQSFVSYGHVGNAAAVFPLQRLGAEITQVNTTALSNHPGYATAEGGAEPPERIAALIRGVEARGIFPALDAVLSGYLGAPGTGAVLLDAVQRVRRASPRALWCCDPVIGDEGAGIYVRPELEAFFREQAAPEADILTPNLFELRSLTGAACRDWPGTRAAMQRLRSAMRPDGRRLVLVSSVRTSDVPEGAVDCAAMDETGEWRVRTELLPVVVNGSGDALAAIFLWHILSGAGTAAALERAVSALYAVIRQTASSGTRELRLIAAQDEIVAPTRIFAAVPG